MEKIFHLKEKNTTISKEVVGGITTFLSMAYILAIIPGILSETGMFFSNVFTAVAISSAIATLCMAFLANLPIALAPGMGVTAFFTYTICLKLGHSWQFALTAVFAEGILFILLSLFGIREVIMNSIPATLKKAVAIGIGLFICLIGLANAKIVSSQTGTIIGFVNFNMENKSALVAIIGLLITIILYVQKIPGSILISIILTTIIGIPFGVTVIPENWKPFSIPASPLLFNFDWNNAFSIDFVIIFITFLFTDLFDTIGTLVGVAEQAKLVDKNGNIPNAKKALLADAIGTVIGACLGTSTVTSVIESSSGVAAGAKTGLSSVVVAFFFMLSLFVSPFFLIISMTATAPALIFVGFLMMKSVSGINFEDLTEGIPAFITIMTMPFSYSISKGIMYGVITYVICKCAAKKVKDIPVVTWILAAIFIADIVFEAVK